MNHEIAVFRKEHFNAAHRLNNPLWSAAKNKEVFGLCNNDNFHGHNYELIVKVTGVPNPETGYVLDMKVLSDLVKEEVLNKFDHKKYSLVSWYGQTKLLTAYTFYSKTQLVYARSAS